VISEGSCDTEDWSNDDKFSTEIKFILKYVLINKKYIFFVLDVINCFDSPINIAI